MDTETGHHFIKDQNCAFAFCDYTQTLKETRPGWDNTHVPRYRLNDNRGDLLGISLE
jgi:hypothetical protein